MVYSHVEYYSAIEREWTTVVGNRKDESHRHYVEWKMPDMKSTDWIIPIIMST